MATIMKAARRFIVGEPVRLAPVPSAALRAGSFDPATIWPAEHHWTKYTQIPKQDLVFWERIDKALVSWYRRSMRYNRMGLLMDDLLDSDKLEVQEAINRLPTELKEARQARVSRAVNLSFHNEVLPKELWTKPEDDVPYLVPYVRWVMAEWEEEAIIKRQDRN